MQSARVGTTILRVIFGLIFVAHAISKFQMQLSNVSGWFESVGVPGWIAYLTAFVELVGGAAMILGLFTRIAGGALGIVMVGAIWTVKFSAGLLGDGQTAGYELELVLLAVALYFSLQDETGYGLDRLFSAKQAG